MLRSNFKHRKNSTHLVLANLNQTSEIDISTFPLTRNDVSRSNFLDNPFVKKCLLILSVAQQVGAQTDNQTISPYNISTSNQTVVPYNATNNQTDVPASGGVNMGLVGSSIVLAVALLIILGICLKTFIVGVMNDRRANQAIHINVEAPQQNPVHAAEEQEMDVISHNDADRSKYVRFRA